MSLARVEAKPSEEPLRKWLVMASEVELRTSSTAIERMTLKKRAFRSFFVEVDNTWRFQLEVKILNQNLTQHSLTVMTVRVSDGGHNCKLFVAVIPSLTFHRPRK